ncbi:hypothetical protein AURDEDRAFT_161501 [Auricularia subglabra TFB-10046 SS5]|nr:hypothetical protein AURDEDRAFT_161501 [Auricularia subglabra TFB-10046 SS5]
MSARFFDILLSDALDFLDMDSLLLSAMPVSRAWREQVVEHRAYWGTIALKNRLEDAADTLQYEKSVPLFLLRLSRTRARPVDLTISSNDLLVVTSALEPHLSHLRSLDIHSKVQRWDVIFLILRSNHAPMVAL